jgi:hypothetical protein
MVLNKEMVDLNTFKNINILENTLIILKMVKELFIILRLKMTMENNMLNLVKKIKMFLIVGNSKTIFLMEKEPFLINYQIC